MSIEVAKLLFELIKANQNLFEVPCQNIRKIHFPDFVEDKLNTYYEFLMRNNIGKLLNQVSWTNHKDVQFLNRIRWFKEAICDSINLYYNGKILDAYGRFNSSLEKIVAYRTNTVIRQLNPNAAFYRIRVDGSQSVSHRVDNFHISFENRHKCSTQRYSIPGMPSLYLGDSVYVCYKEVNNPKQGEAYVSKYCSTRELTVIEIQTIDDFIEQYQKQSLKDLRLTNVLRFLLLYPLYIACTVKVANEGPFKPEYIVPQLLVQYVAKYPEIKGVKFPSTKIDLTYWSSTRFTYNYVFPVSGSQKKGYCPDLSRSFILTKPRSMEEILEGRQLILDDIDYERTGFPFIEEVLMNEELAAVLS